MKPLVSVRVAAASAQQAALDAWLASLPQRRDRESGRVAVIVAGAFSVLTAPAEVIVERVAGCACCVGAVTLRVTLTRLLRLHRPERLLLLTGDDHGDGLRRMLRDPQFDSVLQIEGTMDESRSR